MNKTININLANTFFHIDEHAYNKLQRYLDAIRRSFTNSQGRDEIIADIEARIAELFTERMQHDRQVISTKEVDEVITIMGQPEDYLLDEEIFDDQPTSKSSRSKTRSGKKLYRDIDNKYIGGVCSGLGHYLGIDVVWVRLLFILFGIFSGFGIVAYILFWILAPEAVTTSQKLDMTGEPVNISNIERKVKEGFDDVADKVKSVDYEKVGNKVKSSSKTFFDTIGDIIMFFFKVFAKFVGILFLIIGASVLIGLFIGLFTVGAVDLFHIPGIDFVDLVNTSGAPIWIVSVLLFFAVGIPFFFLFLLGLKILVNNLKPLGSIARYSLLAIWLLSVVSLIVLGARQASEHAYTGSVSVTESLALNATDTLHIKMNEHSLEDYRYHRDFGINIILDDNNNESLYLKDIRFNIEASEDSLAHIKLRKDANGSNLKEAKMRAEGITYNYRTQGGTLILDDFLTTDIKNKFRDQEVTATLYIPAGTVVSFDDSAYGYAGRRIDNDRGYYRSGVIDHLWKMGDDGELKCLDCPEETHEDWNEDEDTSGHIKMNSEGLDIDLKNEDGESFEMKIDEDGVKIKTDQN